MATLASVDRTLSRLRPAFLWLGQIGVVVLGVHLVADRLDDQVHDLLMQLPIPWGEGASPVGLAAWVALCLELAVVARAANLLLLTPSKPELSRRLWWSARSVDAFVTPVFWATTALAGSWTVGMAAEDLLAPWIGGSARYVALAFALLVAWRLGFTGWRRVTGSLTPPKRRSRGLLWAPLLLPFAVLALIYGLPVWGWLP